MRFLLLVIVIIALTAVIQTKRHGCEWGGDDWLSCVVDNTKKEYYSSQPSAQRLAQAASG